MGYSGHIVELDLFLCETHSATTKRKSLMKSVLRQEKSFFGKNGINNIFGVNYWAFQYTLPYNVVWIYWHPDA